MSDKTPLVETTKGYETFLRQSSQDVLRRWIRNGGDVPRAGLLANQRHGILDGIDQLQQEIINALETVFTARR